MNKTKNELGFTIVELLIVIVVIGILAAIVIVAYNGVQRRADNTAIIDTATETRKFMQAYTAANNGAYPYSGPGITCITTTSGCYRAGDPTPVDTNATINANMASFGSVPRSMKQVSSGRGGLTYQYDSSRTVDGNPAPVILNFYMFGVNTDCGMAVVNGEGPTLTTNTSQRYTNGNIGGSGSTQCTISVPGV